MLPFCTRIAHDGLLAFNLADLALAVGLGNTFIRSRSGEDVYHVIVAFELPMVVEAYPSVPKRTTIAAM